MSRMRPSAGKASRNREALKRPTNMPSKAVPSKKPVRSRDRMIPTRDPLLMLKTEFAGLLGQLCETKMGVAFIAAEMLLHVGRGQMAAQLGHHYSGVDDAQFPSIELFEAPDDPNQASMIEDLFLGFVRSIANRDPMLKMQLWKTPGSSQYEFIAGLSFLVGNAAWQNKAGSLVTRDELKAAFDAVSAVHCPNVKLDPDYGGGPWCDWMDL